LRTIQNWKKQDMIIIDNLVYSFANDIENGIPIKAYIKGKEDYELEYIANMLEGVKDDTNMMTYISQVFNLQKFYKRF
jgi:TFIIF-interacting CTD phosphatase-like protein